MKWIILALVLLPTIGCESLSQRHATRAFLFTEYPGSSTDEKDKKFSLKNPVDDKFYSGNPIFIHNNTKFSIKIDEVSAGWIYKAKSPSPQAAENGYGEFSPPLYDPHITPEDDFNHYRGLDLWLLTTISSLNPNDPLETKIKRYFKATNVKFDSQSYSFIPLDSDEQYVFTHESDSSYRVKFQLYSIKGFAVKRELSKIASNPGVWGIGSAVLTTLKNTLGSVAGDVIASTWSEKISEDLAMERFLLSLGATEELHANLVVIRRGDYEDRNADISITASEIEHLKKVPGNENLDSQLKQFYKDSKYSFPIPLKKTRYMVLDYFKTCEIPDSAKNRNELSEKMKMPEIGDIELDDKNAFTVACTPEQKHKNNLPLSDFTYLKIVVTESDSTQKFIDSSGDIATNKGAAYYKNSVIPLLRNINDNSVARLKQDLEIAEKRYADECITTICADTRKNNLTMEIDKQRKELTRKEKDNVEGLASIDKINKDVKLDEWIDHIQRPLD